MIVAPAMMPAGANPDGYARAAVIVIVPTTAGVVVTATVIRRGRAYIDANTARSGVYADLSHRWRGSEKRRGCENADCDLLHGVLLSLRLKENA
jgi:hypothetical protein